MDVAGDVFVPNYYGDTVAEITPGGAMSTITGGGDITPTPGSTISALSAHLDHPESVAVDSSGNVYIADTGNDEVEQLTPSGQLSVLAGGGGTIPSPGPSIAATSAALDWVSGVAVDSSGDVFLSEAATAPTSAGPPRAPTR